MDIKKIIRLFIVIIVVLLLIAITAYGVLNSNFTKLKKYDEVDKSPREQMNLPSSKMKQKIAKERYYTTKVKVLSKDLASLGDFSLNMADGRILTANISLKYKSKSEGWFSSDNAQKEILKKAPVLRNAVINAMHGSRAISNSDDVKDGIKDGLNSYLSEGEVEDVYFNKFIIQ